MVSSILTDVEGGSPAIRVPAPTRQDYCNDVSKVSFCGKVACDGSVSGQEGVTRWCGVCVRLWRGGGGRCTLCAPMHDDWVNETRDDGGVDEICNKVGALRHGPRNYRRRCGSKHVLEPPTCKITRISWIVWIAPAGRTEAFCMGCTTDEDVALVASLILSSSEEAQQSTPLGPATSLARSPGWKCTGGH